MNMNIKASIMYTLLSRDITGPWSEPQSIGRSAWRPLQMPLVDSVVLSTIRRLRGRILSTGRVKEELDLFLDSIDLE
jgi:hypothetical protein